MELEVFPSTASYAPMEPSLTRTTSSVIGGLTLIVLKPKVFSPSMKKLLLNVLLLMVLPLMLRLPMLLLLMLDTLLLLRISLLNMVLLGLLGNLTVETVEDRRVRTSLPHLFRPCCVSSQSNTH